jgi:hypothetical protein
MTSAASHQQHQQHPQHQQQHQQQQLVSTHSVVEVLGGSAAVARRQHLQQQQWAVVQIRLLPRVQCTWWHRHQSSMQQQTGLNWVRRQQKPRTHLLTWLSSKMCVEAPAQLC